MTRAIYVSSSTGAEQRANELGCGWVPAMPADYDVTCEPPCVVLSGAGQCITLSDDGTLTVDDVESALQPLLDAEGDNNTDTSNLVTVQVDPDAVAAALASAQKATTVAGLRAAVIALGQQLQSQ